MSGDLVAKLRLEATGGAQASAEVAKVEQSLKTVAPAANEAAAGVNRAGAASSAASSQLGGNVVTLNRHAAASRLSAAESLNLSRQLTDVAVSAAGGINPMMILIQQGPQIADVFAMAGARGVSFSQALGGVAGQALGLVARAGPFALLAGAVGLVVTGFLKGEAEAARFQNTLTATGNAAGVTAGQYEAMAHRIASATGESVSTSKAALTQLIATGQFSAKTIEDLTVAAERYAQLTGQSTQEILKDFAGMSDGVAKWGAKHAQTYHDLTLAQLEYVDQLEKQGRHEAAAAQLAEDLRQHVEKLTPEYGYLEQAVRSVTNAARDMWDQLLGIGRGKTIDQQLEDARRGVQYIQSPGFQANLPDAQSQADFKSGKALQRAQQRVTILEAEKAMMEEAASSDARNAQKEADAIRKRFLTPTGAKGPQDQSQLAIDAATKQALTAQLALTRDIERIAALKRQEVAIELKAAEDRLAKQRAEGSITAAAQKVALQKVREAAAAQNVQVEQERQAALAERDLTQRQSIGGFLDRQAAAQATLARTTATQNAIELEALLRRQELDRDLLAERNRQQVQAGAITAEDAKALASAQAASQAAEVEVQIRKDRQRTLDAAAVKEREALEGQADILTSQAALAKSGFARNVIELRILEIEQQLERQKLEEVIASATATEDEKDRARARLAVLKQVQANELKQAKEGTRLILAVQEAADAAYGFKSAFKRHDWARAFDSLAATIETIKASFASQGALGGTLTAGSAVASLIGGKTGRVAGTALGIAGSGALLGSTLTGASLGSVGLVTGLTGSAALGGAVGAGLATLGAVAGPIALAAAAIYAAVKIFNIGGKPTNAGAGFDLRTGQLSGDKRTQETEQAAQGAGQAILQMEAALREAGISLKTTVDGLVIGTRDQTQIYLSNGQTLRTAVGDAGAATDAALKAILGDAGYVSDAQKKLVESMMAAGKGFDAILASLQGYSAAQSIPKAIDDAILKLTNPKKFAVEELKRAQQAQRDSLKAAADAGYLTAEAFAAASANLSKLEDLQLADTLKQFSDAVAGATDALKFKGSISDRILELQDPTAFQVKKINDEIDARIAEAKPMIEAGVLGADVLGDLEQLRSLELGKLFADLADQAGKVTDAFADARPKLLSWLDAQQVGPASGLNPRAQREAALSQYQRELAKAQAGDADALGNITGYADRLKGADLAATSSASARLSLSQRIDADIAGLAGRGGAAANPTVSAINQLQTPLSTIAQASAADLAATSTGGKPVAIANLPSMSAMYGAVLTPQTDRLVAANDRSREEIVAQLKVLADNLKAQLGELSGAIGGVLSEVSASSAEQAAAIAAGLAELVEGQRLLDGRLRAGR